MEPTPAAESSRLPDVTLIRLARLLGLTTVLLALASLALLILNRETPKPDRWGFWGVQALNALLGTIPGYLIARRRPRLSVGWMVLTAAFLAALTGLSEEYGIYATATRPALRASGVLVAGFGQWLWVPAYALLAIFLPLHFPNGRLLSPRWRPVRRLGGAWILLSGAWILLHPGPLRNNALIPNPFGVEALRVRPLDALPPETLPLFFGAQLMAVAAFSLLQRYRQADAEVRQQIKWFALSAAFLPFAGPLGQLDGLLPDLLLTLALVSVPTSIALALLRYRLYNLDLWISRTLVYGILIAFVAGIYGLGVATAAVLAQRGGNGLAAAAATALAALLFQPLRERIQGAVNRMMYGDRDDPYAVLSRLGRRLERALTPDEGLQTVVETVARALRLPYVALALKREEGFEEAASFGRRNGDVRTFPLIHQEALIGRLICAPRDPYEPFTPAEEELLRNVARQAGPIAQAAGLTVRLRRSRERLVTAREEERRRLRRDLHDGLGPRLASLTLRLDAARNLLRQNPAAAAVLFDAMKADVQEAIAEIRRLVEGLRPPALDELGLVDALRAHAAACMGTTHIVVEAPQTLPPLSAAVEAAAYRIAVEALTNAIRHARAGTCRIRLLPEGRYLLVEVVDDGVGMPARPTTGMGLRSMRERADELGGTLTIRGRAGGGTRVRARLPLGPLDEPAEGGSR